MFRRIAWAIGSVLLFWAAAMVVLVISDAIAAHQRNSMALAALIAAPATFGLTLLFVKLHRKTLTDFGFELSLGTGLRFLIGLAFGTILIGVQTAIMLSAGGVKWVPARPSPGALWPILGFVLLATREELAFRGYSLRLLASRTNQWLALLVVSCLFVVEHKLGGANWTDALFGSGLGALVFGMAALVTRGLAMPIGLHAAWNIGDWMRGGKGEGGMWRMVIDPGDVTHANQVAWASYAAAMLGAFLTLVLWQRAHRTASA